MIQRALILLPVIALAVACGDDATGPPPVPASLELVAPDGQLVEGDTVELTLLARDDAGAAIRLGEVTWSTSDSSIARVVSGPRLVMTGEGPVRIEAVSQGVEAGIDLLVLRSGPAVIDVSVGEAHYCAILENGAAYCWGWNRSGNLGNGTLESRPAPARVEGGVVFESIAAGGEHTCGLDRSRLAWCWGSNEYGQLGSEGLSRHQDSPTPVPVTGSPEFVLVKAGRHLTCGLTEPGEVWCWGSNRFGQLGRGVSEEELGHSDVPLRIAADVRLRSLDVGADYACALSLEDQVWCWGWGREGNLGQDVERHSATPLVAANGMRFNRLEVSWNETLSTAIALARTCGIDFEGAVWCWGPPHGADEAPPDAAEPRRVPIPGGARALRGRPMDICGLTEDGKPFCWQGADLEYPETSWRFVELSATEDQCAISEGGALYCWDYAGVPERIRFPDADS